MAQSARRGRWEISQKLDLQSCWPIFKYHSHRPGALKHLIYCYFKIIYPHPCLQKKYMYWYLRKHLKIWFNALQKKLVDWWNAVLIIESIELNFFRKEFTSRISNSFFVVVFSCILVSSVRGYLQKIALRACVCVCMCLYLCVCGASRLWPPSLRSACLICSRTGCHVHMCWDQSIHSCNSQQGVNTPWD